MSRADWFARQRLPPRDGATIRDVVAGGGWLQSPGGTGPYLALWARIPQLRRQHVDDAAFRRFDIIELPTVRDSTMLVWREDAGLALAAGRRAFDERLKKLAKTCGVELKELDALAEHVLKIIGTGIRSIDQLRRELPPRSVRDLGDPGKQLGFTTTLPAALRLLQTEGRVIRIPEERRLDGKLHFYRAWPSEVTIEKVEDLDHELAGRFLAWAAPASVDDFAWWAGIGKRAAKAAMESVTIEPAPAAPRVRMSVSLLPFRDNYFNLHRGLGAFLPNAAAFEVLDYNNKAVRADRVESLHHNAIVVDGMLRGLWEYDPDAEAIVWRAIPPGIGTELRAIRASVDETQQFIRDELGDYRFYALDSAKSRAVRRAFIEHGE